MAIDRCRGACAAPAIICGGAAFIYFDLAHNENDRATIMDRDAFLKAPTGLQRPMGALRPSPSLTRADATVREARGATYAVGQAVPAASGTDIADPVDLVTRALAILAEENELWQSRRAATPSRGSR